MAETPSVIQPGTNPTALVQAGNLEVGATNGGTLPFDGKLAQVAVYSAKATQATIKASMDRTLTGNETSLISAYSFDNTINDLSATATTSKTYIGAFVNHTAARTITAAADITATFRRPMFLKVELV